MSLVALVAITTFALCPVPAWFVDLLGLVGRRLSSWRLTTSFDMSTTLAGVKGLLIVTILTILPFLARLLDEMEVTRNLLLIARAGTSAL